MRRDGANATRVLATMLGASKFAPQLQLVLLQGIALAGFNVVDLAALHAMLGLPVLVVARRAPRLPLIREALLTRVARVAAAPERCADATRLAGRGGGRMLEIAPVRRTPGVPPLRPRRQEPP